jgi:hypothetical protein
MRDSTLERFIVKQPYRLQMNNVRDRGVRHDWQCGRGLLANECLAVPLAFHRECKKMKWRGETKADRFTHRQFVKWKAEAEAEAEGRSFEKRRKRSAFRRTGARIKSLPDLYQI